ncbi:hypothetical protein DdX_19409 [Ditylenchus destructor]|uniref:Uncharacterized protein n=1 Tax=Ditylenchus destructor TaxID=166010 RepID=A0AAD4QXA3_9BILA|nr:hypothetical protein DdX_19409 [Ditylenchus destructor]
MKTENNSVVDKGEICQETKQRGKYKAPVRKQQIRINFPVWLINENLFWEKSACFLEFCTLPSDFIGQRQIEDGSTLDVHVYTICIYYWRRWLMRFFQEEESAPELAFDEPHMPW